MKIGIVLINWAVGGAEKRFANLYNYLSTTSEHEYTLLVNNYLYRRYCAMGMSLDNNGLRVLPTVGGWKFLDRPAPGYRLPGGSKIPGLNFITYHLFELAHTLQFKQVGKQFSPLPYDVIHYVFPYYADNILTQGAKVLSCVSTRPKDALLKNRFFVKMLHSNAFFDILNERSKEELLVEKGVVNDDWRLRVVPCSFIDYSKMIVAHKEPLIVFSGQFAPIKNPLLFVEIIRRVHEGYPQARAVMLGSGALQTEIKERIQRYQLEDIVTVQYHLHPEQILAKSQVFLSLQLQDNYPSQALIEAMACGCAIVASDVGETFKLVSDEVGFRVPLNVEAAAEKTLWLLKNPDQATQMGLRARNKVMTEQTIERFTQYLEGLYWDACHS